MRLPAYAEALTSTATPRQLRAHERPAQARQPRQESSRPSTDSRRRTPHRRGRHGERDRCALHRGVRHSGSRAGVPLRARRLVLMRRLWTGERVTFEGRFWQLDDRRHRPHASSALNPALVRGPRPCRARPRRPPRRRLNGRWRNVHGPIPGRAGGDARPPRSPLTRPPQRLSTSKRVSVGVEDDPVTAQRRVQPWFTMLTPAAASAPSESACYGTPEQCAEGLTKIAVTGLGLIALNPPLRPRAPVPAAWRTRCSR